MILTKMLTGLAGNSNINPTLINPGLAVIRRLLLAPTALLLCAIGVRGQGTFVYTNDDVSGSNTVSGFAVGANGALTQIAGSPFSTGGTGVAVGFFAANRVTISTAGTFLYAGNSGSSTISGFSINPATGFLTPVPGSPFPAGVSAFGSLVSYSLAVTPDRKFLFCAGASGSISVFTVGGTGSLTPIVGSPFFVGGGIDGIRVSPDGKFLSAALPFTGGGGSVAMFSISSSGSLNPVSGSPFAGGIVGGADITGIDINCASNLLFAADATVGPTTVNVFNMAPSGVLSAIPGSPFIFGGTNSNVPFLSPNGRFLFVSNQFTSANVGSITVLNVAANGSLSQVPGSPFANPGGFFPSGMGTDSMGRFLFAANFNNTVSAFSVASNGALTPAPGSPFATGRSFGGLLSLTVFPGRTCSAPAFDTCLKDNITGDVFAFNSVTGAYQYTRCRDGFSISGVGTLRNASGVLTLTDSKADRRVSGGFLMGQQTGKVTIMFMVAQGVWQTFTVNDTTSFGRGCSCAQ